MLTGRRCGGTSGDILAVEQDAALARPLEAGEHPQQRGLAAARRPEQREELALENVEGQPLDGDEAAKALAHRLEPHQRPRLRIEPRSERCIPHRGNANRSCAPAPLPPASPPICGRASPRPSPAESGGRAARWSEAGRIGADARLEAGEIGRAERGRLHHHRAVDRRAQDVGQELHGESLAVMPPSTRSTVSPAAGPVGLHRLQQARGSGSRPPPARRARARPAPELRVRPKIAPRASASQYGAPSPTKAGTR